MYSVAAAVLATSAFTPAESVYNVSIRPVRPNIWVVAMVITIPTAATAAVTTPSRSAIAPLDRFLRAMSILWA